jgi:malate/lactate dehydrogenase
VFAGEDRRREGHRWTSGLGITRMIRAIATDSGELFPGSILLRGEYGIEGIAGVSA